MSSIPRSFSQIEPLESRIAPAIVIGNPLPDIVAGAGKTGATVDLSKLTAPAAADTYHTKVQFTTNYDTDPMTAGIQPGVIVIELYDDTAPLSVQNFLGYVNSTSSSSDYDNTIIHRSFDFQAGDPSHASDPIQNDIIQGGGFDFSRLGAHIPTGPEVHNEYSAARPNERGTIAMAKTGESPNTGTSEWFFNVNDNTSILGGDNNGGFTVFGKVVSGMDVVDAIAGLTTHNLTNVIGSVYSDIPLKSDYTSGVPTADQVIRIVDATTLPPAVGTATGLTYSIQHIYQAGTTTPSTLLTGKIAGSTLNLKYTAGMSGLADVVVKISNGTDTVTDTFRVDVRPDLILHHNDFQKLIPGDATPLTFDILNSGAALFQGSVKINLSMVKIGDPNNTVIPLGTQVVPVKIAGGGSQVVTVKAAVPPTAATAAGETYRVTAEIAPLPAERFTDDNTATSATKFDPFSQTSFQIGGNHALVNEFGNFDGRTNVVLKYKSTTGDSLFTWNMTGAGMGVLNPDGAGNLSLETQSTSLASTVAVTSSKAAIRVPLKGVQFDDVIGTAKLGIVDLSGVGVASGGIKSLTLGNLTGESLLLIGSVLPDNATKATITLGDVTNFSLESSMPLASLTVNSWKDTNATNDSIMAPSLGILKANGDFEADVTLTDLVPVTSINVKGLLHNATIKTVGNIGAVVFGGIDSGNIFAGVDSLPDALSDFTDPRTIQSFTMTGSVFTNSHVAAQTLGTIVVKGAAPTGGFIADIIKSYSRTAMAGSVPFTRTNLTAPQIVDPLAGYSVQVL